MEKSLRRYAWIFVLPTLLAFTIGFIIPFLEGLYLSFCQFTTVSNATFNGIGNYIEAFQDESFLHAGLFTVMVAVVSIIFINVVAFVLAMMLTQKLKGTNFFRAVFFMPNLIGGIVLGHIWSMIFDGILSKFSTSIVMDSKYGFWGLIILMCWQQIGYMMIIYIAGLQSLPGDVLEAAQIDGASPWQKLWHVTVPMIMPSVTICTFLTLTNSFKLFDQNFALTAGAPMKKTAMLALDIYNTFYGRIGDEGVGQAKAVLFFLLVAAIAFFQLWLTRKREVEQ